MALKRTITKADFDKLSDPMKAEYKVDPTNADSYALDVEGEDPSDALKRAKDHANRESAEAKVAREAAEKKLADAQKELNDLNGSANNMSKENLELKATVAEMDKIKANSAALEKRLNDERDYTRSQKSQSMKEAVISKMSSELAGKNAKLLGPHIAQRLDVVFKDDNDREGTLVIKGADGKASATLTTIDLQKEFASNADFGSILIANRASGSGRAALPPTPGTTPAVPGAPGQLPQGPTRLSALPPDQLRSHVEGIVAAKQAAKG